MLCEQCGNPLHQTPWVSLRRGIYAFLCTPECKEAYEAETYREAWTQFRFPFDQEVPDVVEANDPV